MIADGWIGSCRIEDRSAGDASIRMEFQPIVSIFLVTSELKGACGANPGAGTTCSAAIIDCQYGKAQITDGRLIRCRMPYQKVMKGDSHAQAVA
jgi:hypothetical protein